MAEIKKVFSETNSTKQKEIDSDAACFIESINFQLKLETISTEDNAILFYISGYIARSIKKTEKCTSCCRLLVKGDTVPTVNIEDAIEDVSHCASDDKESFFHEINRGGLCYPSDILFIATVHAYEFYSLIFQNDNLRSSMLNYRNPREVFVKCFIQKLKESDNTEPLRSVKCENGHCFMKSMEITAQKVFNIGSKNYVSEMNSRIHAEKKQKRKLVTKEDRQSPSCRKICKLQSVCM